MNKKERTKDFVQYAISRIKWDPGFRARFVVAVNPDLEYRVWPELVNFCDIANEEERRAFALVGSYIARERLDRSGSVSLGRGIRLAEKALDKRKSKADENVQTPGEARLYRIINCSSKAELIEVLRRVILWISSSGIVLDCESLLDDILKWGESVKVRWVKEFYKEGKGEE